MQRNLSLTDERNNEFTLRIDQLTETLADRDTELNGIRDQLKQVRIGEN